MKVLLTVYPIGQLGGFINTTEHLITGLRENGHDVTFAEMVWATKASPARRDVTKRPEEWETSPAGTKVHQWTGWNGNLRIPYKGPEALRRWKEYAEKFDVIIWLVPVPTKRKENRGNMDWVELYSLKGPRQIAYANDGNLVEAYPYFMEIARHLKGIACTHSAGYANIIQTGLPSIICYPPQVLTEYPSPGDKEYKPYKSRKRGFNSFQTFKGLKHVEDLVEAVPYLPDGYIKNVAGAGLQYNYLATAGPDKMPPRYIRDGEPIWNTAVKHGLNYLGVIPESVRNRWMRVTRTFVDSSWSKSLSNLGGHFNRTAQETFLNGGVLVARNLGIGTDSLGRTGLFDVYPDRVRDEHFWYVMAPWDCSPKGYAEVIEHANELKSIQDDIDHNHVLARQMFDANRIAERLIWLAREKGGHRQKANKEINAAGKEALAFFTGDLV